MIKNLALLSALLIVTSASSCRRHEAATGTGRVTRAYALEYLEPGETLRALQSLNLDESVTVKGDHDANRIVATFSDPQHGELIADLLEQIDRPHVNPPSRFVALEFVDAAVAANEVGRRFTETHPPFNVLPDVRTNRVFLVGNPQHIEAATILLHRIDAKARSENPSRRTDEH